MTLSSLKASLSAAVVAAVLGMAGTAGAATVTTSVGSGLAPAGATLYNFDNGVTPSVLSLNNAAYDNSYGFFGSPPTGSNGTLYLAVMGNGTATFTFGSTQKYFGLLWGSPDSYNTISFYNGNSLLTSYSATDIAGLSGEQYVNFFTTGYDKVILASSGNSFEVDNVRVSAVPLPAALPLFGAALAGLGVWGRRRARKTA